MLTRIYSVAKNRTKFFYSEKRFPLFEDYRFFGIIKILQKQKRSGTEFSIKNIIFTKSPLLIFSLEFCFYHFLFNLSLLCLPENKKKYFRK